MIAIAGIVVGALDVFGLDLLPPGLTIAAVVVVLGAIGLHLVARHVQDDEVTRATSELLKLVELNTRGKGLQVRLFASSIEIETYLGQRILTASKQVCDLSWKTSISSGFSTPTRQVAHGYMDKAISDASSRVNYREIFVFNDVRRADRFARRLKETHAGYSCRFYDDASLIPRLQFVVVDSKEVIFFASGPNSPLAAVQSEVIAQVFETYFESLWSAATPLKDGGQLQMGPISQIVGQWPQASWPASLKKLLRSYES
ncbi:hypothetical protein [Leifsonella bigeumensis]|uniref:hypothetical protein n=1 Tax=Leifsonella bigeumensis TaxID=433643 RepID=UPI0031DB1430